MPDVARHRFLPHESMLLVLGASTALALLARGAGGAGTLAATTGTLAAAGLCLRRESQRKARLVASYAFIGWFYLAVVWVTPTLGLPLRDGDLRAADEMLLGRTPAVPLEGVATPWLTDLLSVCYASYLVYLHGALLYVLLRPVEETDRLAYLFSAPVSARCSGTAADRVTSR